MPLFPPQDYRKTAFTHRRGLAADRPAAADVLPGTLYFSTDTNSLDRSNGTIWESYSGGSTGATGPMGPPGIDGIDGTNGIDGLPGIQGPAGPVGASGSIGAPGINGVDGEDGEDSYLPGPTGPQGIQGIQGIQGPTGPSGLDAEEPEEPLMIPGPQGPQGPAGGGGGSATTIEVNLGATATWRGKFTITDAAITTTSKILAWQAPGPYTGKGTRDDEAEMQSVKITSVFPSTGSAVAYWETPPMISYQAPAKSMFLTSGTTVLASPKDPQNIALGFSKRLGKVRGNVKFTYMVM